jgi:hypothetical protein
MPDDFLHAPLPTSAVHLCIDMQNLFAPGAPWAAPWIERVTPVVAAIAERFAAHTIFTRFIPPERADDMPGAWKRYYTKWREITRERIDPELLALLPPLARLAPPAIVIDKTRYSAFAGSALAEHLAQRKLSLVKSEPTDCCEITPHAKLPGLSLGNSSAAVTDDRVRRPEQGMAIRKQRLAAGVGESIAVEQRHHRLPQRFGSRHSCRSGLPMKEIAHQGGG